jgi:predicted metal-binding membrane protein
VTFTIAVSERSSRKTVAKELARFSRRHPEWAIVVAALATWVVLVATHLGSAVPRADVDGQMVVYAHAAGGWLLMVVAMMALSTVPMVRYLAFNSLARRRSRAITAFCFGYLTVWVAFGAAAAAAIAAVNAIVGSTISHGAMLGATLMVAAGFELTAAKGRSLRACHLGAPLPPRGLRADVACGRLGLHHGVACVGSCWALMLAMAVAGHAHLVLMGFLTMVVGAQKLLVAGTRLGGAVAPALVAAAVVAMT